MLHLIALSLEFLLLITFYQHLDFSLLQVPLLSPENSHVSIVLWDLFYLITYLQLLCEGSTPSLTAIIFGLMLFIECDRLGLVEVGRTASRCLATRPELGVPNLFLFIALRNFLLSLIQQLITLSLEFLYHITHSVFRSDPTTSPVVVFWELSHLDCLMRSSLLFYIITTSQWRIESFLHTFILCFCTNNAVHQC